MNNCKYCREYENYISGYYDINTDELKSTAGYKAPTTYRDYLRLFILKCKNDDKAGLMIQNLNGTRYVDINYCPWCGRKL